MEQRILGGTGRSVGVIGLGAWQLGADWGQVSEEDALVSEVYDELIRPQVHHRW